MLMTCRTINDVVNEINSQMIPCSPQIQIAKAVYDWEICNIQYDTVRFKNPFRREILPPEETLLRGRGICTDMSALYVAITRQMGLESYYANVEIDQENNPVKHACAVVKVPYELQVDPAYSIFNARHKVLHMTEPDVLANPQKHNNHRYHHESFGQKLAATAVGVFLLLGAAVVATSPNMFQTQKGTHYETSTGHRFRTDHGKIEFTHEARDIWKEAVFYHEAQNGNMNANELLKMLVETDQNSDNHISHAEAADALMLAKEKYRRN